VDAVEEPADTCVVPPLWTEEREQGTTEDDPDQRRDREDAEDVDPGGDVVGLAIGRRLS
jgi:hypothetical protein